MEEGTAEPSWKKPVGRNHRKQAVGRKPALMPDILTTSFAVEALKRTWVDLMLCVASGKNGGVAANLQSTTILRVSCLWGGNDHEAGNQSLATRTSAAAKENVNKSQRKTCKQHGEARNHGWMFKNLASV